MKLHLRVTGCHLPYGITLDTPCHPTQVNTPHLNSSHTGYRPLLDLSTPEGWKAELTYRKFSVCQCIVIYIVFVQHRLPQLEIHSCVKSVSRIVSVRAIRAPATSDRNKQTRDPAGWPPVRSTYPTLLQRLAERINLNATRFSCSSTWAVLGF